MRSKKIKTCDSITVVVPWSDLNHDVLILVMMKIGAIDFIAFSGVCKSWRSLAIPNRNKFMSSKLPMSLSLSTHANQKECCLEDFDGRKFKTTLPHSSGRVCIGLTCGYFILFDVKIKDFWLVNPITRHQLHFHHPFDALYACEISRGILAFSLSISEWVLVVVSYYKEIWFCIMGKEWTGISTTSFSILDLIAFKGKIYALHFGNCLSEVRLFPTPKATLLEIKNLEVEYGNYMFVSSGENLYVIDRLSKYPYFVYKIREINSSTMEWVSRQDIGDEYALFFSKFRYGSAAILAKSWAEVHLQYERYVSTDRSGNGKVFSSQMWYFLHDCLNANLLHEG